MSFGRTFWRSSDSRWCWCHSASGVSGNNLDDKQMTIRYSAVIWLALGAILQAQAPPPQGTPAAQLPLSGRGGQGGSVNTVETPVPGRGRGGLLLTGELQRARRAEPQHGQGHHVLGQHLLLAA